MYTNGLMDLQSLKALVLEKLGKTDEASALALRAKATNPSDDITLTTLQTVFQRLNNCMIFIFGVLLPMLFVLVTVWLLISRAERYASNYVIAVLLNLLLCRKVHKFLTRRLGLSSRSSDKSL